ncbi:MULTISPECIES: DUF2188 domain-containing protein [unclassified Microbulbifer]|uniref:DUF2188 domain-containing protein n=1 Tax=unclassified Microbulbifer TaxID=2619833 RepID=UPI0027E4D0C3|nr:MULTISPECIES: DUF2188 domain-containing protein [unclassified Microbulbifer]
MAKKPPSQHVVKSSDGWAVKKGGSTKATKVFSTQKEAVTHGRSIAKNQKAEFYVHGRDGKIREKDSYGRDLHPPKDKK